ncbi:MAG: hypothetical protein ABSE18_02930 [Minisyncoccia bacterium]|jgi:hypothetical protein
MSVKQRVRFIVEVNPQLAESEGLRKALSIPAYVMETAYCGESMRQQYRSDEQLQSKKMKEMGSSLTPGTSANDKLLERLQQATIVSFKIYARPSDEFPRQIEERVVLRRAREVIWSMTVVFEPNGGLFFHLPVDPYFKIIHRAGKLVAVDTRTEEQ